jgi:hypothetical protein
MHHLAPQKTVSLIFPTEGMVLASLSSFEDVVCFRSMLFNFVLTQNEESSFSSCNVQIGSLLVIEAAAMARPCMLLHFMFVHH